MYSRTLARKLVQVMFQCSPVVMTQGKRKAPYAEGELSAAPEGSPALCSGVRCCCVVISVPAVRTRSPRQNCWVSFPMPDGIRRLSVKDQHGWATETVAKHINGRIARSLKQWADDSRGYQELALSHASALREDSTIVALGLQLHM